MHSWVVYIDDLHSIMHLYIHYMIIYIYDYLFTSAHELFLMETDLMYIKKQCGP